MKTIWLGSRLFIVDHSSHGLREKKNPVRDFTFHDQKYRMSNHGLRKQYFSRISTVQPAQFIVDRLFILACY